MASGIFIGLAHINQQYLALSKALLQRGEINGLWCS